jgi:hypothetical protein
MDDLQTLDDYISGIREILKQEEQVPDSQDAFHFPGPDLLEKILWGIILSPIASVLFAKLYEKIQKHRTYEQAKKHLSPQELVSIVKTTTETYRSEKVTYLKRIKNEIHMNLDVDEEKTEEIMKKIEKVTDKYLGD